MTSSGTIFGIFHAETRRRNESPEYLVSVGPGRWSGQSGKELVLAEPFLHPETERRATEVSRFG
ncbi:MAG: hypothetical protein WAN41_10080, partial [Candidatus Sulfotelmatobacter sp.]